MASGTQQPKVVLVGVRPSGGPSIKWLPNQGANTAGYPSKEGLALVEFALARLVVPGDTVVATTAVTPTSPNPRAREEDYIAEVTAKLREALNASREVAEAKHISLRISVRQAGRARDALLREAAHFRATIVVVGPGRRHLIGGMGDGELLNYLTHQLPRACKLLLVDGGECRKAFNGLLETGFPPAAAGSGQSSLDAAGSGSPGGSFGGAGGGSWMQAEGQQQDACMGGGSSDFALPSPSPPPPPSEILREAACRAYGEMELSFADLQRATNNWERLLGVGGAGEVYWGRIRKSDRDARMTGGSFHQQPVQSCVGGPGVANGARGGEEDACVDIAVKRVKWWGDSGSDKEELRLFTNQFVTELRVIRRIRHPNLLSLMGVSVSERGLLMVFDLMPNGSLDHKLRSRTHPLSWSQRMAVACGAAEAIAFLHNECNVIHRDIKSGNILLDSNMQPVVSDFGLAKFIPNQEVSEPFPVTAVMGTKGYVAPEYYSTGMITKDIDVYAFGVVLFELITGHVPFHAGRNPPFLSAWAVPVAHAREFTRLVDYRLQGRYAPEQLEAVAMLATLCLADRPKDRPTMAEIAKWLRNWQSSTNKGGH